MHTMIETVAPWAEPVLHTADELAKLPADSWRYELVHGRLVRMPPTDLEHSDICGVLYLALRGYVDAGNLGLVTLPETGFIISRPGEPDTVLAPDLAFVRHARLPSATSWNRRRFPQLAPDLAVEVASPSQHRPEMAQKARMWLQAGSELVWVIWPTTREVDVWSQSADQPSTVAGDAVLDGADVLPGFTLAINTLWTDPETGDV